MREAIPDTFKYLDSQVEFVMNNGYINIDDRTNSRAWFKPIIKYLRDGSELTFHDRKVASGGAMNYPIQGTQASMIKEAIVEIGKAIREQKIDAHLLSTVHDELVYEQGLEYDGVSEEYHNIGELVLFKYDKPVNFNDIQVKTHWRYSNDWLDNGLITQIETTFPEFVKLTMCQVANRYLKHYTMGAEYHVTPYWTK